MLVSPYPSERSQSVMAAGGINAVLPTCEAGDSLACHVEDTLRAGSFIAGENAVFGLCSHAGDGAVFANDCFLVAARNSEKVGEMRDVYGEHFGKNCSKSLSCMTVCPANIPVIASIAKMNRAKVKSKTL